jgi:hypothetical protein
MRGWCLWDSRFETSPKVSISQILHLRTILASIKAERRDVLVVALHVTFNIILQVTSVIRHHQGSQTTFLGTSDDALF